MRRGWLTDAAESLARTPGRAGLALASLTVGFVCLALLQVWLQGLRERERALLKDFGAATIELQTEGRALTPREVSTIRQAFPNARVAAWRNEPVPKHLETAFEQVLAVEEGWWSGRDPALLRGRIWHPDEQGTRVAVAAAGLVPSTQALPYTLPAFPHPLRVVGESTLLEPGTVAVPMDAAALWSGAVASPMDQAQGVRVVFNQRVPTQLPWAALPDGLTARAPEDVLRPLAVWRARISWLFGGITLIALGLGAVGIGSLFALSVRERIPEIGLRRSLGATPLDIAGWLAGEAVWLTLLGTLLGIPLVWAISRQVGQRTDLYSHLDPLALLGAMAGLVVTVAIATALPVRHAALLPPAEALRND